MNHNDELKLSYAITSLEYALMQLEEMTKEGQTILMDESLEYDVFRLLKRAINWSKEMEAHIKYVEELGEAYGTQRTETLCR